MNISNSHRWRNHAPGTKLNFKSLWIPATILAVLASVAGCAGSGGGDSSTANQSPPFKTYYVYTANEDSKDISVFAAAQDGTLKFVNKVASPDIPHKLIVSGSTLYAACNFKLEVFSGAASGKLSLIQTVVTDDKNQDFYPSSLAFGYGDTNENPPALLSPTKLYVLAGTGQAGSSVLQSYSIAANGTIALKNVLESFSGQGTLASLSDASGYDGINIIGVTNLNNTVSLVLDDGKSLKITDTVKLSSAPLAILSSIQADLSQNFYVADQASKKLYEVKVTGYGGASGIPNNPKGKVVTTLSVGTTPSYLGTSVEFPTGPEITSYGEFFTANGDIGTISVYDSDELNQPFQKVSGSQPDAGADVTAVNGIKVTNAAGKDVYYVYSTNKSGMLRFYSGSGTLTYNKGYDTQGSGVVDLAVTSEIGPTPTNGGGSGGGGNGGGGNGGGGKGPFVEYFNGSYLANTASIDFTDNGKAAAAVLLGQLSGPYQLTGEKSTTIAASPYNGTKIASASETYDSANRYLILAAADKFGAAIDTYVYAKNAYPTSSNEWLVVFNGIPDFISNMDYYVLGPGQTLQNSTPAAANVSPGVGAFVSIPANLGNFTVVATYAGGKSVTDVISTSSTQTSKGATSIVADLADVNNVYSFVFATESQTPVKPGSLLNAPNLLGVGNGPSRVRRR